MASSGFPQRKAAGAGAPTSGGPQQVLDAPPPSPVMAGAQPPVPGGTPAPMPTFDQMSRPLTAGTPGRATSPEIAMGIIQASQTIYGILDSIASVVPDLAADMAMQKDLLQRSMAKLVTNAGTVAPAGATGNNFPGGGFAAGAL